MRESFKFYLALIIALFLDLADYFLFAWIPVAGDILDVAGVILLYPLIKIYALIPILELVPGVDFVPTFVFAVVAWKMDFLKRRRK